MHPDARRPWAHKEQIREYLDTLFHDLAENERINVRPNLPEGRQVDGFINFFADNIEEAVEAFLTLREQEIHSYVGVNPRDRAKVEAEQEKRARWKEDKKENTKCKNGTPGGKITVSRVVTIFSDYDYPKMGKSREQALEDLRNLPCPPSMIVDSGGGLQPYWLLEASVTSEEGKDFSERVIKAMASWWGADNVQDYSRILRVPGTLNLKYDPPRESYIEQSDTGEKYTLDQLWEMVPEEYRTTSTSQSSTNGSSEGFLRDGVIHDGNRDEALFKMACSLRNQGMPEELAASLLTTVDREHSEYPGGKNRTDKTAEEKVRGAYRRYKPGGSWGETQRFGGEIPPFPIDALPVDTRDYLREMVKAFDCPADLVGVPFLAALSAAIGMSAVGEIIDDWTVSATLYTGIVAPPGSAKSPILSKAFAPIKAEEIRMEEKYEEKMRKYGKKKRAYDALGKKERVEEDPPEKPTRPRTWMSDVTVEAVAERLHENPRGILLIQDEMSGWMAGFNQYKPGGKGNDRQHYLSWWSNESDARDRRGQDVMSIKSPFVTICGGIQPARLGDLVDSRGDGFSDRFLIAYPPPHISESRKVRISREAKEKYHQLIGQLYGRFTSMGNEPEVLEFSEEAGDLYIEYSNRLGDFQRYSGLDPGPSDAISKLKEYLGRIALILAVCRIEGGLTRLTRLTPPLTLSRKTSPRGSLLQMWRMRGY